MVGVGVFSGVCVAEGSGEAVNVGDTVGDGGVDVDVDVADAADVAWLVGAGSVGEGEKLGLIDVQPMMAKVRKITRNSFFMFYPMIVLGW